MKIESTEIEVEVREVVSFGSEVTSTGLNSP